MRIKEQNIIFDFESLEVFRKFNWLLCDPRGVNFAPSLFSVLLVRLFRQINYGCNKSLFLLLTSLRNNTLQQRKINKVLLHILIFQISSYLDAVSIFVNILIANTIASYHFHRGLACISPLSTSYVDMRKGIRLNTTSIKCLNKLAQNVMT